MLTFQPLLTGLTARGRVLPPRSYLFHLLATRVLESACWSGWAVGHCGFIEVAKPVQNCQRRRAGRDARSAGSGEVSKLSAADAFAVCFALYDVFAS